VGGVGREDFAEIADGHRTRLAVELGGCPLVDAAVNNSLTARLEGLLEDGAAFFSDGDGVVALKDLVNRPVASRAKRLLAESTIHSRWGCAILRFAIENRSRTVTFGLRSMFSFLNHVEDHKILFERFFRKWSCVFHVGMARRAFALPAWSFIGEFQTAIETECM